MLIEDMIIYSGYGAGILILLYFLVKLKFGGKKESKVKIDRSWTLTPPTSALGVSKMKNTSTDLKGVQRKTMQIEKPKNKAVNWKDTGSFEEDIGEINLDNVINKRAKRINESENTKITNNNNSFEKRGLKIDSVKNTSSFKQDYKIKVLLVDDSAVILKKTGDMLKANGYDVITKKDGSEAILWLEENISLPEVVITDMEMPKMTGEELVESMRKDERFQEIPVLVISAHAERHIGLMEKQMIQGFLKKPFSESDLMSQIDYFLSN